MRVAVVRGAALNRWELQSYERLGPEFEVTAIGARNGSYAVAGLSLPVIRLRTLPSRVVGVDRGSRLLGLERALVGYDVVHAAETFIPWTEQVAAAKARNGSKVVLTCWENIPFLHDEDPALAARKDVVRAAANLFLAVTPEARRALELEGVAPERIRVQPAGVDRALFRPLRSDRRFGDRVVLYVGRLIREKGLSDLVLAMRGLGARLVLVGSGPERPRLETMAAELEVDVVFPGPLGYDELPAAYAAADVVVLPSVPTPYWEEQFGMVLAEALACGRAIVATRSGSIPSVLGDAALLVPPCAPEALAEAIRSLLDDPGRRRMFEAAALQRSELYDSGRVAEGLKEAYRAVLAA